MTARLIAIVCLLAVAATTHSAASSGTDKAARTAIAKRFPGVTAENVSPTPVNGLYEVMVGPVVVYTSADGRYLVKGEIIDLESDTNLTEARVAEARQRTLAELPDDELIVFGPPDSEHVVTVFTDVSCSYCRALHNRVEEYNRKGIQVRYAAYPRNGLASDSWQTMERVWCAEDRQLALTRAKRDEQFTSRQCDSETVMEQWQLGRMLGVRGTPAIFTESGKMIPGYLPPDTLLQRLESEADK